MSLAARKLFRVGRALGIAAALLAVAGSSAWLAAGAASRETAAPPPAPATTLAPAEKLSRAGQTLRVPANMLAGMGVTTAPAVTPTDAVTLPPFQATLALDTDTLSRVRARFPGEVVALGELPSTGGDSAAPATPGRSLTFGDRVDKGQLLAVVWSASLGAMKSDLVEAVSRKAASDLVLRRLNESYAQGAAPANAVRAAERAVEADKVALDKAERALRTARLADAEVRELVAEGERLSDPSAPKADPAKWARVEVRSPVAGTIQAKNVTAGDIIDSTQDLYKVADLSHLTVWAHVYEEDLPLLKQVGRDAKLVVSFPSRAKPVEATITRVSPVIDPAQHTALIQGRIDNPSGELFVGQSATAQIHLPPPTGEVAVPAGAVAEDGQESVAFVELPNQQGVFERRVVAVSRRTQSTIYLRGGVKPGERVMATGSLLLRDAMELLKDSKP